MHSKVEAAVLWHPWFRAGREQVMLCLQDYPMGPVNHTEIIQPRESKALSANYRHC